MRLCYLSQGWTLTETQISKLESKFTQLLRYIVAGGNKRQPVEEYVRKDGNTTHFSKYCLSNDEVIKRSKNNSLKSYIINQQTNWIGHVLRSDDTTFIKQLTFPDFFKDTKKKPGVLNTTYRQVRLHHLNDLNLNENEMITRLLLKNSREVTALDYNSSNLEVQTNISESWI